MLRLIIALTVVVISIVSVHSLSTTTHPMLLNKKCLVTGASGGIGKAIAIKLAEHGARVLVHYNTRRAGAENTCQTIRQAKETCKKIRNACSGTCDGIMKADFRCSQNIHSMFKKVDEIWDGEIDVLVNNAGLVTKLAIEDDDDDLSTWHETMSVNLHAPLLLSKLAHQRMKRGGRGGSIIMNSSIHGSTSVEWMTAYAASKAALDHLTRGLSNEWARDGVRVNAVAPGVVPVERTEAILNQPEAQKLWLPHLPVGRMGTVEDIAEAVLYICSADWMSGSILTVDGGMTARSNMPIRGKPAPNKTSGQVQISSQVEFDQL
uniref:Glucose 1-dehydrogenase n=1 Tax=Fibrocapsa japonica TaxID=94617 RepID=A0A7S2XWS6_9STRA|mmetsp:Transcript_17042/g.24909  ORF Transcript_17042/g.24909 Transcript_17042/m.24909 type:complete len:320 (+) Transcript_17042:93-1052(+)